MLNVYTMKEVICLLMQNPHSRQSAISFSPVVGIGTPPITHSQASLPTPPFGSGGTGTLPGERWGGKVPIPTMGHIHTVALFIYKYFVPECYGVKVTVGQPGPNSLT
jgi:hypothetical protein